MPRFQKVLRMDGYAITSPQLFRDRFSPGDFLRNKELAAYFAIQQLERLSPAHTYFCELLDIAVTRSGNLCGHCSLPCQRCLLSKEFTPDPQGGENCSLFKKIATARNARITFSGHWGFDKQTGYDGWSTEDNKQLMEALDQDPFRLKVHAQVCGIVSKTNLKDRDQGLLTVILYLGYLLAGWLPEERPISPEEAEAAFLGKDWTPEVTFRDTPEGRVYPARGKPYRLTLRENTSLPLGKTVTLRKLIAGPSEQGNTAMPVVFQLPDRRETLMPGDYRYASFVDGEMIRLYPVEKKNGERILLRQGNTLYLKNSAGALLREIPCAGRSIVDLVPGPSKEEYILLTADAVDYTAFHNKALPDEDIVELRMQGNTLYLLTDRGQVLKHGDRTGMPRRTTLDGLDL